ncbi:MAG TPA: hypothetical protein DCL41_03900 [Bdellovibrionales bacterium]|nr:hypothetical protein [Pseudobdellovibrionaceae bacterium]HAG90986.1 hypothetical protein [Bdellovibrionales bacterium]|tara:strand:+ start:788 stop:1042 length:255 start_codon:yes stop_codon:yes gene_type:complete
MKKLIYTLTAAMILSQGTMSFAQSCKLAADGSVTVSDLSLDSKKKLWNACIDRKLAQLDPSRPGFEEMGQEAGDVCVNSDIICQ